MIHKNKARYTHSFAHSSWRLLIQDEPNDTVITWQHYHKVKGKLKWVGMGHLDQSKHNTYHAHMSESDKSPIDIGANLNRKEKIIQGMMFLKTMAKKHKISYGSDYLQPEDVHIPLASQVNQKVAKDGTTAHSVSITATAAIITARGNPPTIKAS